MQAIGIRAREPSTVFVEECVEVKAACPELCYRPEEAGKGDPPCIDVEIIGNFPEKLRFYADWRSGDVPFAVGPIARRCRNDPIYQPGLCLCRRRLQLRTGRRVR